MPYKAMCLVVRSEYPNCLIRHYDLDSRQEPILSKPLLKCLTGRRFISEERAVRSNKILEPVVKKNSLVHPLSNLCNSGIQDSSCIKSQTTSRDYKIQIGKSGSLEDLRMVEVADTEPGDYDVVVDIHFSALNYRDVLKVLDKYPKDSADYLELGDECTGEVIKVGTKVDPAMIGRYVIVGGGAIGVAYHCTGRTDISDTGQYALERRGHFTRRLHDRPLLSGHSGKFGPGRHGADSRGRRWCWTGRDQSSQIPRCNGSCNGEPHEAGNRTVVGCRQGL